jgi:predicted enzyme related to lactoylglutathione lyase
MDPTVIHFEIPAKNVEKLKGFYEKVFSWKIEKSPPNLGIDMEYWLIQTVPTDDKGMLKRPGVNGGMYKKELAESTAVNYIAVADIDKAIKEAKLLGAKVVSGKSEVSMVGWVAILRDPEGNPIGMLQPTPM